MCTNVGLGRATLYLMPTQLHPPQGQSPQFLAHVCRGQTAGWIKIPLGTKVGLGPGHIVLQGNSASPIRCTDPQFSARLLWSNGRPSRLLLSTCSTVFCSTARHKRRSRTGGPGVRTPTKIWSWSLPLLGPPRKFH